MKTFQTTFDNQLLNELPHLQNYPQMLPYIGSKWGENKKILFLAESHYIPGVDIKSIYPEIDFRSKWYDLNESYFDGHDYLKDYINTRSVIEKSDDVHNSGFSSPLTIYYNIKEELKKNLTEIQNENFIFPYFSIYNYFQRPSFIEGETIQNTPEDDSVAFKTLKKVFETLNPEIIIFVSKKAFDSFNRTLKQSNSHDFKNVIIERTPHAGSAWWNMQSEAYGGKTGREHFINIIKSI